jgi:hypothetical protein
VGSAVSAEAGSWVFPQPVSARVTAKNAATAAIFSRIKEFSSVFRFYRYDYIIELCKKKADRSKILRPARIACNLGTFSYKKKFQPLEASPEAPTEAPAGVTTISPV